MLKRKNINDTVYIDAKTVYAEEPINVTNLMYKKIMVWSYTAHANNSEFEFEIDITTIKQTVTRTAVSRWKYRIRGPLYEHQKMKYKKKLLNLICKTNANFVWYKIWKKKEYIVLIKIIRK